MTHNVAKRFFSEGYTRGRYGEFMWSLDEPKEIDPWKDHSTKISPALLRAYDEAVEAFRKFINEIIDGKWMASGIDPTTGVRHDLNPREFARPNLIMNVRDGKLFEDCNGMLTLRWSDLTLTPKED